MRPLTWSPGVRALTTWLIVGIWIAVLVMAWVSYRATREGRRSSELLLERRAEQTADLLLRAIRRDMRGIEDSLLNRLHWSQITVEKPYELSTLVARAFARYPYPEAFFGWSRQSSEPAVFFLRSDRRPGWLSASVDEERDFPVTPVRDARATHHLLSRLKSSADQGHQFAAFEIHQDSEPYQVVARLMYGDERRSSLESIFGFVVNMRWVRESYFPEILSQVVQVAGVDAGMSMVLMDENGKVLAREPPAAGSEPSQTGETIARVRRQFRPLFFEPRLVAADPPPDLASLIWTIEVGVGTGPVPLLPRDGRTLTVTTAAALVLLVGLVLTARALRTTADLAKVRSDFVTSVTHELKTPLATIRGVGEALAGGRLSTADKVQTYGQMLDQEAKRLTRLVDNILAYSRVTEISEAYTFEPLAAADLIEDALRGFQLQFTRQGFDVDVELPPDLPPIRADRTSMSLVLDNLIDNALRYSGNGRWLGIRAWHSADKVHVLISDCGEGIPPDEIDRVMQRFVRGRHAPSGGSGLGLAIANRLIEDQGGTLSVRSKVGRGTEVEVVLPAMDI